jgi:hypothetical protein
MTFWDTPKGVLLAATVAAALGGVLGFEIGQSAVSTPIVIVLKWIS